MLYAKYGDAIYNPKYVVIHDKDHVAPQIMIQSRYLIAYFIQISRDP